MSIIKDIFYSFCIFSALFTALLFIKCDPKSAMTGDDYRLYEGTVLEEFANAVEHNDTASMKELVNTKPIPIDFPSRTGTTLLMMAISNGQNASVIDLLLELGANPNKFDSQRDGYKTCPIFEATRYKYPQRLSYLSSLLKHGANVNAATEHKSITEEGAFFVTSPYSILVDALSANKSTDSAEFKKTMTIFFDYNINLNMYDCEKYMFNQPTSIIISKKRYDILLFLLMNGLDYNEFVYFNSDNKKVTLLQALRLSVLPLGTEQYNYKMKVVDFLNKKGFNYFNEPIPSVILGKIQQENPTNWKYVIEKY